VLAKGPPRTFGTKHFDALCVHHFAGLTLEDLDSRVVADSRQLPHIQHIVAA